MTPQTSAAARLPLDPATIDETLATIFAAQRAGPDRTPAQLQAQREAGVALIAAFRPRDPVEATYAARAAAAHYGAMECFRRAMLPDIPDNAAIRWHGKAVALSRMNTEMIRELRLCQAEAPRAQPQPAARPATPIPAVPPAMPTPAVQPAASLPPAPAAAARGAAALAAKPAGGQACPPGRSPVAGARALEPKDPMSSERKPAAPGAAAGTIRPAALPAAPAGGEAGKRVPDPRAPCPGARPSLTPAAASRMTEGAARSLPAAPPPRQGLRAELLGSTDGVAAMLATAALQARPHVQ